MVSSHYFKLRWLLLAFSIVCLYSQAAANNTYNSGRVRGVKNMKRLLRTNPNHIPVINENEGEAEGDQQQEKANKYKDNQTGQGDEEEEPHDEVNLSLDSDKKTEDKAEKYKESTAVKGDKAGKKTKACKTTKGKKEPCDTSSSQISSGGTTADETVEPTDKPTNEPTSKPTSENSGDIPDESQAADLDETNPSEPSLPSSSNPSPSEPTRAPRPSSTDGADNDDSQPNDAEEVNGVTIDNPDATPTVSPSPNMPPAVESSDETCQTLANGSFGFTTAQPLQVNFFFQVETTPSVTRQAVNEALLPLLESGIGGRLLAFLFDECRQAVSARGESNIICEAQGYSGFPQDRVLDGGELCYYNHSTFVTRPVI